MPAMLTDLTDEELAERCGAAVDTADRDAAFHELVRRYEHRVYGICYRYFGNHADAEDAAQDTFLTLARKIGQFRRDSRFSTWLYRVATNACHDLARRDARRPRTPVADVTAVADPEDDQRSADDAVIAGELAQAVQRALLELDELSRTLIVMCAIEGHTYAEASAQLDLPVGTIKSRVFRARAKLTELLGDVLDGDEPAATRTEPAPDRPGAATARRRPPSRGPPA